MDAVELLMHDHASIRITAENDLLNSHDMMDFQLFLMKIHVAVEEKIVFPALVGVVDYNTRKTIDTLIADHKLLDKFYGNLLKWKEEENPLYTNRLPLFYKTLTYHNSQEEKLVFPAWKHMGKEPAERALKEAHEIIESAGIDMYMKETGVSLEMLNYIFL
ncbi:MAG: hypothetical protein AMDU4_FER2C00028G0056 [Ferroplasma sp. Type II]|uniref:hemerythrin domain-containing protein n=1 Tax=Ferroplasma sp. Type II TaxID=261388 RepID=UPI0003896B5A|nr:hemerythrin domain-containing protein [Ferroplasma sp. Type II]EQB74149.1 MAG: hypothetical protein AMDU4_FER2C00028G0056 [Ferroplasma sp. Type II]